MGAGLTLVLEFVNHAVALQFKRAEPWFVVIDDLLAL